ncbi:MAG: glycerophosphodiester phosphodiesterase family protein, partial [Acidimicrobiia bacterium]|nr:glycerophosphodiester phosphodiesterase family protein [Acidimicrobiia bacterium]
TFPDARFTVDLKQGGLEDLLVSAINKHDLWDRVIVGSFRDRRLARFRRISNGRVATSSGPRETARLVVGVRLGRGVRLVADALQVPTTSRGVRVVDEKVVAAVHALGKQVHVWTVNERSEMIRLLDIGVDGIITDRPDTLKDLMIERGTGGPWNGDAA